MQLVNGAQFLDINFSLVLLKGAAATTEFGTAILPLTCMHASVYHINLTLSLKF